MDPNLKHTDHLANQRTFLAWIRTNLGIIAFGFVVERFSFFTEKIAGLVGKTSTQPILNSYSFFLGIAIIFLGTLLNLFAFFKYKKTEKQITENNYQSSLALDVWLTLFVCLFGVILIAYLILTL
jgi:putative membrane protein